ncbi:hypothetical protein AAFF_G00373280 [Aldrovandia affinis]|uniref:Uncharacterized protein n=1 Tax=Aldrovandia affinis TaxID=143900 RepID=A0AAD7SGU0_9TELE|nr:hypothetical protein AAFF_G00373280 [Aldrovandia affinis]
MWDVTKHLPLPADSPKLHCVSPPATALLMSDLWPPCRPWFLRMRGVRDSDTDGCDGLAERWVRKTQGGSCCTWLPEDELRHGLGIAGVVLCHALVKALIRFHQTKDLEVASALR